jgi:hypothetical protein
VTSADSDRYPMTYRPYRARWVVYPTMVSIVAVVSLVAWALPGGQYGFGASDRIGMLIIGFGLAGGLGVMVRPRAVASAAGLRVTNLFRTRQLTWGDVLAVRLPTGAPWALLDLADGETLPVMAIQTADAERGRAAAAQLAELIAMRQ